MSGAPGLDRRITAWLDDRAVPGAPDGLLGDTLARTSRLRPRPAWRIPERWVPMPFTLRLAVVPRALIVLLVLAALMASLALGGIVGGSLQRAVSPAPPTGVARNGLIAYSAYTPEGGVWLVDERGEQRRRLTNGIVGAWSPDGEWLAYWSGSALKAIRPGDVEARTLWSGPHTDGSVDATCGRGLSWSPDGTAIAFTRHDSGSGQQVDIVQLDGRPSRMLMEGARSPSWSPDGRTIAYLDFGYARHGPSWADAGISLISAGGGTSRPLTHVSSAFFPGGCGFLDPQWSPDGRRLAFQVADDDREYSIWIANEDGSGEIPLTAPGQGGSWPRWSPDGSRLVYGRLHRAGNNDEGYSFSSDGLVVSDPDGANQVVLDDPRVVPDVKANWSPDGTRLVAIAADAEGGSAGLVVLDPTGVADPLLIPAQGAYDLAWQPVFAP